jgi:hypothetical protein
MQRMLEMNDKEREECGKRLMEIYRESAPSFLSELDKEFP